MPETRTSVRAWWVAAATMAALVAAAGFRSSTGALLEPLEAEFGWSPGDHVGRGQPQPGHLRPHGAVRGRPDGALRHPSRGRARAGAGRRGRRPDPGDDLRLAAVVPLGRRRRASAPARMALVFGAIVANRWFVRHRGLVDRPVLGGELHRTADLPARDRPPGPRSRVAVGRRPGRGRSRCCSCPLVLLVLRDRPSDVGEVPYGAPARRTSSRRSTADGPGARRALALTTLREASRRWTFWALFLTFWICGWSTNGLIGTHFIPAAHDHGMPETTSAGLLALIGIFDIVGTVASRLADRPGRLAATCCSATTSCAGCRLLVVPALLGPHVQPSLFLFIVFYGLDWVATVPPTVALCRIHFGLEKSGRRLRLGVRLAHGRRRRRRVVRRLDPAGARRLLRGLDDGGGAVPAGVAAVPLDPAGRARSRAPRSSRWARSPRRSRVLPAGDRDRARTDLAHPGSL